MSPWNADHAPEEFAAKSRPAIRDQSVSQADRRVVTILFADLSGFTSMAEQRDPETVRDILNACFERLVPVITKYGGIIDKFIGDEIMALFGAPAAHENDPERALRAAVELMSALAEFNQQRGTALGMHIGVNTGHVIAGGIGTAEQQEYTVLGDAVNLAARLADAAEENEILVGPDTHRLTRHRFQFASRPPLRVKGKSEPVNAHRLVGALATRSQGQLAATRRLTAPLVGRTNEYVRLKECVERLFFGQGGLVSVIGEAGQGKTRLIGEVDEHFSRRGLLWLEGRALSLSQNVSYWPLIEVLRSYAEIAETDDDVASWTKLEVHLRAVCAEETDEILPYVGALLGLYVDGPAAERIKYLNAEAVRRQIFRACRRLLERVAQVQPVVLLFEDVHWLDESSAVLIEHLLPLVREVPLLICATSRDEPGTPARDLRELARRNYEQWYTEIILKPLSPADTDRLVLNLLGSSDLPPRLREIILQKTGGNPFFVEEILRSLVDTGVLVHDETSHSWRTTVKTDALQIPDTVHGVIIARIDRLDEELKQILRAAAVIGRRFFRRVLSAITEAERALDRDLDELQELELIRQRSDYPELEYVFKHALVQEATYESILVQRRRDLHQRVLEAIELAFGEHLEEFYGELAYHATQSENWTKAQEYLVKAGDRVGAVAGDAEALAYYRQALATAKRVFGEQWPPHHRAQLERKIGEALFRRGDHQQAIEALHRALDDLGSAYPLSKWGVRFAIVKAAGRQLVHRLIPWVADRSLIEAVTPAADERARIFMLLAWIDYFSDDERLVLDALWLLNGAEREGPLTASVQGLVGIGIILDALGFHRISHYYLRRARDLGERTANPSVRGFALVGLGVHQYYTGDWDSSRWHFEQSAASYRSAGDLRESGAAVAVNCTLSRAQGQFDQAERLARQLIQEGTDMADLQVLSWGLQEQGNIRLDQGAFDEAVDLLSRAVEHYRRVPDNLGVIEASGSLGRCYVHHGKLAEALEILEENERLLVIRGATGHFVTPTIVGLAEAYLLEADRTSNPERAHVLRKATDACRRVAWHSKRFRDYLIADAARVLGTLSWLANDHARARKHWQRSLTLAEEHGLRHAAALTKLDIGRRTGDLTAVQEAVDTWRDLGATGYLIQACEVQDRLSPDENTRSDSGHQLPRRST